MGRKSKADVRKQEILEHFYEVLKEEGFENASIAKIATRMDVNPSLLIHYFHTKEEMVVEVVDFILMRYEDTFLTQLDQAQDVRARFEHIMNTLFGLEWVGVVDYSVFYACYYLASRHPRIQERFKEMYQQFREILTEECRQWMAAGLIAQANPEEAAELLIILNEGLSYYGHIFPDPNAYQARATAMRRRVYASLGATI